MKHKTSSMFANLSIRYIKTSELLDTWITIWGCPNRLVACKWSLNKFSPNMTLVRWVLIDIYFCIWVIRTNADWI